jgi:hypothetical protein
MFGSLGVFLVYVPILPLAVVVTILLGLILMFMLGVQTGGKIRISRRKNASRSRVAQWILRKVFESRKIRDLSGLGSDVFGLNVNR